MSFWFQVSVFCRHFFLCYWHISTYTPNQKRTHKIHVKSHVYLCYPFLFSHQWGLWLFWPGSSRFLSGRGDEERYGGVQQDVESVWGVAAGLHRNGPGGLDHIQVEGQALVCCWQSSVFTLFLFFLFPFWSLLWVQFCVNILYLFLFFYRSKTYVFEEFLFTWQDRLRKLGQPTAMSVKLQAEVDKYKVDSTGIMYRCLVIYCAYILKR